jgi:hypothetical protein
MTAPSAVVTVVPPAPVPPPAPVGETVPPSGHATPAAEIVTVAFALPEQLPRFWPAQKLAQSVTAIAGLNVLDLLHDGSVTVHEQHAPPPPFPVAAGLLLQPKACKTYAPKSIRPMPAHRNFVIEASFKGPSWMDDTGPELTQNHPEDTFRVR